MLAGLALALSKALFAYDAWYTVTFVAEEVHDSKRTLPYSLLLGTVVVTVVYVLANLAYLAVLPVDQIAGVEDDRVAVAVGTTLFGNLGAKLVIVAVLVSTFGCLNGLILGGARLCYAMARDGLFLRGCANLHPRTGTPATALVYQGIVSIALTFTGSYSGLLTYTMFASVFFTGLMVAAVYRLRIQAAGFAAALSVLGLPRHAGVVPGDVPGVPGVRDSGQPAGLRDRRAADPGRDSVLCDLAGKGWGKSRVRVGWEKRSAVPPRPAQWMRRGAIEYRPERVKSWTCLQGFLAPISAGLQSLAWHCWCSCWVTPASANTTVPLVASVRSRTSPM